MGVGQVSMRFGFLVALTSSLIGGMAVATPSQPDPYQGEGVTPSQPSRTQGEGAKSGLPPFARGGLRRVMQHLRQ